MTDQPVLFDVPEDWWHYRQCPVCGCATSLEFTHTYVVQRQWWIKIGATSNPRRRINELSRPAWAQHILSPPGMDWTEPLTALTVLEGNLEHDLHRRFAPQHEAGEWFSLGGPLQAWLDEQRARVA